MRTPDRSVRRPRLAQLVVTAALLMGVVLAVGLWQAHAPITFDSPGGSQVVVRLPDGSAAELSGETRLHFRPGFRTFPFSAAAERSVRLEGEAFFTVVPGDRPFRVHTHNAIVEVVGTSFIVRARSDEAVATTRVTVASGVVRVVSPAGESIEVQAQRAAEVATGRVLTVVPAPEAVTAWRDGGFSIHERPLADVLREVERRFGVAVFGAPDLPYNLPLTLYYSRVVDAETVLHDIALAADLQYHPLRGGYDVRRRTPPSR